MTASTLSSLAVCTSNPAKAQNLWPFYVLFFVSGFPALLYQIVWQRALFTIYGVNIQSVTVIVTVFMLGLGLGSLAGGRLSTISRIQTLRAFGFIELSIGAFGVCSLSLFKYVAQFTAGASTAATGIVTFLLLLVPTLLMGSTLPLLVAFVVRRSANVGDSVGSLYSVNTFGSGTACLFASLFLMWLLGESGSVRLAASLNLLVGAVAIIFASRATFATPPPEQSSESKVDQSHPTMAMTAGMALAAASGFIALAYEILWFHIYSFVSGGTASCFARLLAFYLFGIAYGSLAVRDACRQKLKDNLPRTLRAASLVGFLGTIAAFLVGPAVAFSVSTGHIPYPLTFLFIAIAAALLGAAFPILSHAAIGPTEEAGKKLSYLYLSNIIGSALGSFIIGFVVLDRLSTGQTSVLLLVLGSSIALILALLSRPLSRSRWLLGSALVVCAVLAASSHVLFSRMYERLFFKDAYQSETAFTNLVENRSGTIAVDSAERVFGGGIYDGQFNVDPVNGRNGIFRAYAIAAIHPHPRDVLIIGLASGSWAQVLANHPEVQDVAIVEINPGYSQLIQQRPMVSSLLRNPRVHIVIDDGRRWLMSHPARKFDFILMNTTFNWRANATNLLSVEFMQILRQHLNRGGVAYYNTTSSGDVQFTGASVFPYALRISDFLAVSDSPIIFDRERFRKILMVYRIDERPAFDLSKANYRTSIEQFVSLAQANSETLGPFLDVSIEDRTSLVNRLKGNRLITDDNMGTEWR
jgi:spermidine synthase